MNPGHVCRLFTAQITQRGIDQLSFQEGLQSIWLSVKETQSPDLRTIHQESDTCKHPLNGRRFRFEPRGEDERRATVFSLIDGALIHIARIVLASGRGFDEDQRHRWVQLLHDRVIEYACGTIPPRALKEEPGGEGPISCPTLSSNYFCGLFAHLHNSHQLVQRPLVLACGHLHDGG